MIRRCRDTTARRGKLYSLRREPQLPCHRLRRARSLRLLVRWQRLCTAVVQNKTSPALLGRVFSLGETIGVENFACGAAPRRPVSGLYQCRAGSPHTSKSKSSFCAVLFHEAFSYFASCQSVEMPGGACGSLASIDNN